MTDDSTSMWADSTNADPIRDALDVLNQSARAKGPSIVWLPIKHPTRGLGAISEPDCSAFFDELFKEVGDAVYTMSESEFAIRFVRNHPEQFHPYNF